MAMTTMLILGGAALFGIPAIVGALSSCLLIVREKSEAIIETFGSYSTTKKKTGLTLKWPAPIQTVRAKVPTNTQQFKMTLDTKSKDEVFVGIPISMHLRVTDSYKATYEASGDPVELIKDKVSESMKTLSSAMDFADLYQARDTFATEIKKEIGDMLKDSYGYEIVDVIVDEPNAPESLQRAYTKVRESERELLAANNESEAEKVRIVKRAEAKREAQALSGKAIAEQRAAIFENYSEQFNKLIEQGMSKEAAEKLMALAMTQDTLRDIGEQGNLIIASGDGNRQLADFQALGKTLGENAPNPKPRTSSNDDTKAPKRSAGPRR